MPLQTNMAMASGKVKKANGDVGTSGRHEDEDEEVALIGVKAYEQIG